MFQEKGTINFKKARERPGKAHIKKNTEQGSSRYTSFEDESRDSEKGSESFE